MAIPLTRIRSPVYDRILRAMPLPAQAGEETRAACKPLSAPPGRISTAVQLQRKTAHGRTRISPSRRAISKSLIRMSTRTRHVPASGRISPSTRHVPSPGLKAARRIGSMPASGLVNDQRHLLGVERAEIARHDHDRHVHRAGAAGRDADIRHRLRRCGYARIPAGLPRWQARAAAA